MITEILRPIEKLVPIKVMLIRPFGAAAISTKLSTAACAIATTTAPATAATTAAFGCGFPPVPKTRDSMLAEG